MTDVFSKLQSAAHAGAFGMGSTAQPTPAQIRAGNYAKGTVRLHGLRITIETPMFQSRRGKDDGKPWSITCMAHYGYVNGTRGADGDAVDVFVGPAPESLRVYVINQKGKAGTFDEHKVMLGFIDQDQACTAYMNSYEKGWTGLGSVAACTIKQFKYWLKHGDLSRPLSPDLPNIPKDEALSMTDVFARWGADNLPVGQTVGALLYELRRSDPDGLMFDSATMADITESLADDGTMLDAMVIEYKQFERKAGQLLKVMQNVGGEVQAATVEVSKPFKNKGTTQVAMLFGMSDGQSVSVFFHNPDSTPNKLMPADELISWKWVQNKKDITAVVAPESGQDLNPRIVARRIMSLIQKNSAKFIKANEGKAARTAALDEQKALVESKTAELAALDTQISELTAQLEAQKAELATTITPEPVNEPEAEAAIANADASNASYMASTLAKIPAIKAEIEALGGVPMTEAEFMDRVNAGTNQGFSVAELQSKLADAKAQLAGIQSGSVKPRTIVGKGGTKKGATAWLNNMIAEVETALANDGFMYTVNVSNYAYNLNAQLRELKAKAADPVAPVSTASILLEDYADVAALGSATVLSVGSENVYFDKDGKQYMTKLLNTDDYEPKVGEVVDLSGVVDPYTAPASKLSFTEWEGKVLEALAELMEVSTGDADAIAMGQAALVKQLYDDSAVPSVAALAIKTAATVEPDINEVEDIEGAVQAISNADGYTETKVPAINALVEQVKGQGMSAVDEVVRALGIYDMPLYAAVSESFGLNTPGGGSAPAKALAAALYLGGVNPPTDDEDTGTIEAEGRDNAVKTAKGTKVVTGFKVIEAKNLIISHETDGTVNPEYPPEIQPRDRARTTSQAWVQKTARNLDPDSLGRTQRADSGAPIVGADRVVESGNGRAMAIREAYRIGQADEYREWLVENAEYFGVDPAKIQRMKAPVLVRVRKTAINRVEFAVEANQDDKLAMTATEKARSDAKRLDAAMLAKLADGDLNSAANRDFVAAFLQSLGDAEAAQYLTTDGKPTSGLISRLQAALFAGAYSDDRLLEMTADQAKPEIANIVSALNSAAPDFMRAKEQDRVGAEKAGEQVTDSLELSLNQEAVNAIIGATNVLRQAKEAGMGLDEFLRQGDMFGGTDPAVAAMAVFISANNRSAKRMSTAFKAMAQFVESENIRKQTAGLFGDEPASFTDIVGAANRKLEQEYGEGLFAIDQGDMFSQPTPPAPPVPEPEGPNEDDALQAAKSYLDSIIGGTTDLGSPGDVLKELERIYAAYGEDKLSELFVEASDAFRDYALKATAGAF
ncbi:hypothetical protein AB4P95_29880 (plasmid) [Pseudomonas sp. A1437]|uniref:defense against restriction DarA-related protein n=1 Tax=Pseudomonas sp. A1437 TaxID=3235107 RepID=UPI0037849476